LQLDSQVKALESAKQRLEATVRELKSESTVLRKSQSEKTFEVILVCVCVCERERESVCSRVGIIA
jgi:hypothetical protein